MKKTINQINYDNDADTSIGLELIDGFHVHHQIMMTKGQHFYLHTVRYQLRRQDGWENAALDDMLDPESKEKLRMLNTIRPMTIAEARRWTIENFLPVELRQPNCPCGG